MTQSRFLRLFLLSSALVLVFLPLQLYVLYRNASIPLLPYSWKEIHGYHWMDVVMMPTHGEVPLDRWITIVLGIFVFLFFGLGSDAMKMYRKWFTKLRLDTNFVGLYSRDPVTDNRVPAVEHDHGSLASLVFHFCKKRLSWRRSSSL
ncbi:MAG: hypothetical protein Q9183_002375, partial [Haloplaca sp. 2 TL-2023]